jgi:UDP-N-acetylmuramate dehydrogenase
MSRGADLLRGLRAAGYRGEALPEAPLAPRTTWRIGGPAELLARPLDRDDLQVAVQWAAAERVPLRVLGNGSNLLVADAGVRGLVVHLRKCLDEIALEDNRLTVGAGASLPAVARLCAARGLAGLEFGTGIPGTLGGAVVMNAGWHEFELRATVRSVQILDAGGDLRELDAAECAFDYRHSRFRGGEEIVVGAALELEHDRPAEIRARLDHYAASRKANQPTELPSCGSVFLKPPGDFAGRLIDRAGLKGLRVGDVEVSDKHANFFVNVGHGTAADALELVERVEAAVLAHSGVHLTREFEYWD